MGQPIIYLFYAIVGAMILFFGINVIIGLQETGEDIQYVSLIGDLEKITIPNGIDEICFVGTYESGVVNGLELDSRIQLISDYDEVNLFFGGVELEHYRHKLDVIVDGTICDNTKDRELNLILENMGRTVEVK